MTSPDSIRVLLVEDQQLIRRGLTMLLSTAGGIEIVAQASDGETTLAALADEEVDVVSQTRACLVWTAWNSHPNAPPDTLVCRS